MVRSYDHEMAKLPDWWPKWIPERCDNGHPLGPGKINQSWVQCSCAGAEFGGHHVQLCRVNGKY